MPLAFQLLDPSPPLSIAACTYCTFVDLSTFYQRAFYLPISIIMSVLSFASSFFFSFFSVFFFLLALAAIPPTPGRYWSSELGRLPA